MNKIFVVQETNVDFAPAEAWGELVFMSVNGRDDFHNIIDSEHNERLLQHLMRWVREYNQEEDYFILSNGSPYVAAAVMWALGRMGIRKLRMLRWDNRDRTYRPLHLQLN